MMLVVASREELAGADPIWGHGGWLMPQEREALDWATLGRLSGWTVEVAADAGEGGSRWIIVARDPDRLDRDEVQTIRRRLEHEDLLVVTRAPGPETPMSKLTGAVRSNASTDGRSVRWQGPGGSACWSCQEKIEARALELSSGLRAWALLDGRPAIVVREYGRGRVATLGFHPSAARDADGGVTALLRRLLTRGGRGPVPWVDFEGVVVLRMDDPGSAEAAYHRSWAHPRLAPSGWRALGMELARRGGRLSIGYVGGWVDDGDERRGDLEVASRAVARVPGAVHPSSGVRYMDRAGVSPGRVHDLAGQKRAIEALRKRGLADVELHGFTHMHPARRRWAIASDRADTLAWYRELDGERPRGDPLAAGLEAFRRDWGANPTTLIPPGDAWTREAMVRALDLEFELFDSYYLALRDGARWWWSQHVCSPYLDLAGASWFTSGLPVVGYFHERDVALDGPAWFAERLEEWEGAGARRFISLRELADALSCRPSISVLEGELSVDLGVPEGRKLSRRPEVKVYAAGLERRVATTNPQRVAA